MKTISCIQFTNLTKIKPGRTLITFLVATTQVFRFTFIWLCDFFYICILVADRDAPSPVGFRNKTKRQGYKGIDIL